MLRVLLPTDFSDNSFEAITYALLLFKDIESEFHLLHTYMPPVYNLEYLAGSPGQIGLGDMIAFLNRKHSFFSSILFQPFD